MQSENALEWKNLSNIFELSSAGGLTSAKMFTENEGRAKFVRGWRIDRARFPVVQKGTCNPTTRALTPLVPLLEKSLDNQPK